MLLMESQHSFSLPVLNSHKSLTQSKSYEVGYTINKFKPDLLKNKFKTVNNKFSKSAGSQDLRRYEKYSFVQKKVMAKTPLIDKGLYGAASEDGNDNIEIDSNKALSHETKTLQISTSSHIETTNTMLTFSSSFNGSSLQYLKRNMHVNRSSLLIGSDEECSVYAKAENEAMIPSPKFWKKKLTITPDDKSSKRIQWSPKLFLNDKTVKLKSSKSSINISTKKVYSPRVKRSLSPDHLSNIAIPTCIPSTKTEENTSQQSSYLSLEPLDLDYSTCSSFSSDSSDVDKSDKLNLSWPMLQLANIKKQVTTSKSSSTTLGKEGTRKSKTVSPVLLKSYKPFQAEVNTNLPLVQPKPTYGPVSTVKAEEPWTAFPGSQVEADISGNPINSSVQPHIQQHPVRTAVVQPLQKEMVNPNVAAVQPLPHSVTQIPHHIPVSNSMLPPQYMGSPRAPMVHPQPSTPNQIPPQPRLNVQPIPVNQMLNQPLPSQVSYTPGKAQNQGHVLSQPEHQVTGLRGQRVPSSDDSIEGHSTPNPWCMNQEQRQYYIKQFMEILPDLNGKIDGQTARNFFTKSRLPIVELSHIWELSDMDQDGHLNLDEFCAAFHLVVARKNGYDLPVTLPQSLIPTLIDIGDGIKQDGEKGGNVKRVSLHINQQAPDIKDERVPPPHSEASIHKVKNTSPEKTVGDKTASKSNHQHQDHWETFSDRTSSSTTLANFDHPVEHSDSLAHPVPTRITPSRHEAHSARISANFIPKSTDEGDSTPPQPSRVPAPHRSLTNPYDSLRNEISEPDTSFSKGKRDADRRRSSSSSSSENIVISQVSDPIETVTLCNSDEEKVDGHQKYVINGETKRAYTKPRKGRRHSTSLGSSSSIASDHSSATDNSLHAIPQNITVSDQEHSDWSSRPLRPRSGSESSDTQSLQNVSVPLQPPQAVLSAPTPPPRPNQISSKSNSLDKQNTIRSTDADIITPPAINAPTPPPRPQQQQPPQPQDPAQESFADFSQFDKQVSESPNKSEKPEVVKQDFKKESNNTIPQEIIESKSERPIPAPRQTRDNKLRESSESEAKDDESTESEKLSAAKKAPTKPPRSRMLSTDVLPGKHDTPSSHSQIKSSLSSDDPKSQPTTTKQDPTRSKSELQQAIRSFKQKNTELTRLNAELQQQLKDVMQSRIAVEMSIHQLRPFSQ